MLLLLLLGDEDAGGSEPPPVLSLEVGGPDAVLVEATVTELLESFGYKQVRAESSEHEAGAEG